MIRTRLFVHVVSIINVLVCGTQSSPIHVGPGSPQQKADEIAWKNGFYQPIFPGPYTLMPGVPPVAQRRTVAERQLTTVYTTPTTSTPPTFANSSVQLATSTVPLANSSVQLATSTVLLATSTVPLANSSVQLATSTVPLANSSVQLVTSTVLLATSTVPLANSSVQLATSTVPLATSSVPFANSSVPLANSSAPLATSSVPLATSSASLVSAGFSKVQNTTITTTVVVSHAARHSPASRQLTTVNESSARITTLTVHTTYTATPSTTIPTTAKATPKLRAQAGSASLKIAFQNNLASSNVHVYITGLDINGNVVMLTTSGSFYYPSTSSQTPVSINANIAIPLSSSLTIPGYISSARLWFADGTLDFQMVATASGTGIVAPTSVNPSDPSHDVNWGFVELTYNASGLFANISYVDFVGLPLGIKLASAQSAVQSALGVPADGVAQTCKKLKAQASSDGQPWDQLCIYGSNGKLIRVNSPGSFLSTSANAFSNYFTEYVNDVWELYSSTTLTIKTQNGQGNVACRVGSNSELTCAGDNRSYPKPTAADIFGCSSGPFGVISTDNSIHLAVVPRLCAAFNRATLHRKGGHVQPNLPPEYYYQVQPNNKYSQIVHEVEVGGRGYAFPYDDVAPNAKTNVAGSVYSTDPVELTVIVGGAKKRT